MKRGVVFRTRVRRGRTAQTIYGRHIYRQSDLGVFPGRIRNIRFVLILGLRKKREGKLGVAALPLVASSRGGLDGSASF